MPMHKSTKNLSEIGKFFRNNDASSAMFNILRTINSLRLPEKVLFGRKSRCNQLYSFLNVFVCLLIGPCFMIRNPYNYEGSPLSGLMGCKKDVFYSFLRDVRINWRKLMYHVNVQLWTRMEVRSDHRLPQDRQEDGAYRACPFPSRAQEHPRFQGSLPRHHGRRFPDAA